MSTLDQTSALLRRAQSGDRAAAGELLEKYSAPLRRWASGRLPRWARGLFDTGDLVQEALFHTLRRISFINPERAESLEGYLRAAVLNRIRDEVRKVTSRPAISELNESQPSGAPSPLDVVVGAETVARYERALLQLEPSYRKAIVAHVELGCSHAELAALLGKPSPNAARMTLHRALLRLAEAMNSVR